MTPETIKYLKTLALRDNMRLSGIDANLESSKKHNPHSKYIKGVRKQSRVELKKSNDAIEDLEGLGM